MTKEEIRLLISNDTWMMEVLRAAEDLDLPQWVIGAGFVRNKVWNSISNHPERPHSTDIDLAYFDPSDIREQTEKENDKVLRKMMDIEWSTKNQARMHPINNQEPYVSTEDALAHWPETATSVGVTLKNGELKLIAPYGVEDLANLIARPCPKFSEGFEKVKERAEKKGWFEQWPNLKLEQ